jgi:hypothetical protein
MKPVAWGLDIGSRAGEKQFQNVRRPQSILDWEDEKKALRGVEGLGMQEAKCLFV